VWRRCVTIAFLAAVFVAAFLRSRAQSSEPETIAEISLHPFESAETLDPDGWFSAAPNWDLSMGRAKRGDSFSQVVQLTNQTSSSIRIAAVYAGCSCEVAEFQDGWLAPGEELELRLKVEMSAARPGDFLADFTVVAETESGLRERVGCVNLLWNVDATFEAYAMPSSFSFAATNSSEMALGDVEFVLSGADVDPSQVKIASTGWLSEECSLEVRDLQYRGSIGDDSYSWSADLYLTLEAPLSPRVPMLSTTIPITYHGGPARSDVEIAVALELAESRSPVFIGTVTPGSLVRVASPVVLGSDTEVSLGAGVAARISEARGRSVVLQFDKVPSLPQVIDCVMTIRAGSELHHLHLAGALCD
jgi:hypothetical protein